MRACQDCSHNEFHLDIRLNGIDTIRQILIDKIVLPGRNVFVMTAGTQLIDIQKYFETNLHLCSHLTNRACQLKKYDIFLWLKSNGCDWNQNLNSKEELEKMKSYFDLSIGV